MRDTWKLLEPLDAIVFDCDGTLSGIEGIDALADYNGVATEVKKLTAQAMGHGITLELYEERLSKVRPTQQQVRAIGEEYIHHATRNAKLVIELLQHFGKSVYILSAGLLPSVKRFGQFLGVKNDNIYAVDIIFNSQTGAYQDFDRQSPLTNSYGKGVILSELKHRHARITLIGDGMNDFLSAPFADDFIGFGGHYYRDNIAAQSPVFIRCPDLLPVLALCLTAKEAADAANGPAYHLNIALNSMNNGDIIVNAI